ncbi:MAG TPA: TIGR01777 family oxidoreductase, partial [Flavisolibacter sp.]|nr:TIGR01777 family oxidoreductase [Flavisolibacter sp.]
QTVLITGGTGLIGSALTELLLSEGYRVIILTRKINHETHDDDNGSVWKTSLRLWNVEQQTIDASAIKEADYIVHLAGANIAQKRWTKKRKAEIKCSRVKSCQLLVKSLSEIPNKVRAVISASAIGWYGADPTVPNPYPFKEDDIAATDFLGNSCWQWEHSIMPVISQNIRLVILRTGIVLSKKGGAYNEFRKPLNYRIAPVLGDGKQVISWIHIDDITRVYLAAIKDDTYSGVYNAVAPNPVSNRLLMQTMAAVVEKKPLIVPVPAVLLRTALGEMSFEVLKSTTVSSEKLMRTGFNFLYPDIETAIRKLEEQ